MSKIQRIEIDFPTAVSLPDGFEKTLDALIGMVCEQYERENPVRVMWPAGCGAKPLWREPEEPEYDDAVYFIEVAEREDTNGRNPHNPERELLRAQYRLEVRRGRELREKLKKEKQAKLDA